MESAARSGRVDTVSSRTRLRRALHVRHGRRPRASPKLTRVGAVTGPWAGAGVWRPNAQVERAARPLPASTDRMARRLRARHVLQRAALRCSSSCRAALTGRAEGRAAAAGAHVCRNCKPPPTRVSRAGPCAGTLPGPRRDVLRSKAAAQRRKVPAAARACTAPPSAPRRSPASRPAPAVSRLPLCMRRSRGLFAHAAPRRQQPASLPTHRPDSDCARLRRSASLAAAP